MLFDTIRQLTFKVSWWFSGEVAKMVELDYHDTSTAILFPVVWAGITLLFGWFVASTPAETGVEHLFTFIASLITVAFAILTTIAIAASLVYARECTEIAPEWWEVSR